MPPLSTLTLGCAIALAAVAGSAHASEPQSSSMQQRWAPNAVIRLQPTRHALPPGINEAALRRGLIDAAETWTRAAAPCALPPIQVSDSTDAWRSNDDGVSLVAFRGEAWCYNGLCTRAAYPRSAAAMTTVRASSEGIIGEADIELNAVHFDWATGDALDGDAHGGAGSSGDAGDGDALRARPLKERPRLPLRRVLVHELGHVLGLRDRCGTHAGPHGAKQGHSCSPDEADSVMVVASGRDAPTRRDVQELCALYQRVSSGPEPTNSPPIETTRRSSCTCELNRARDHRHAEVLIPLITAALLTFRRRLRRTTPPQHAVPNRTPI